MQYNKTGKFRCPFNTSKFTSTYSQNNLTTSSISSCSGAFNFIAQSSSEDRFAHLLCGVGLGVRCKFFRALKGLLVPSWLEINSSFLTLEAALDKTVSPQAPLVAGVELLLVYPRFHDSWTNSVC